MRCLRINEDNLEVGKYVRVIKDTPISRTPKRVTYPMIRLISRIVFIIQIYKEHLIQSNVFREKYGGPLYFFIKQVGVYTPRGVVPPARHLSHIVHTKIVNVIDTTKHSPTFISHILSYLQVKKLWTLVVDNLMGTIYPPSMFGTPPSPHLDGAPPPRIPPLLGHFVRVKKGVNPPCRV